MLEIDNVFFITAPALARPKSPYMFRDKLGDLLHLSYTSGRKLPFAARNTRTCLTSRFRTIGELKDHLRSPG